VKPGDLLFIVGARSVGMNLTLFDLINANSYDSWINNGDAMILIRREATAKRANRGFAWQVLTRKGLGWCFEDEFPDEPR
jgi:hypothetical protein